jgi:hypothetical protein
MKNKVKLMIMATKNSFIIRIYRAICVQNTHKVEREKMLDIYGFVKNDE